MKELILKRERVFHFLSLGIIAASLFLKDPFLKVSFLVLGILGLLILSVLKKQNIQIILYGVLLLLAITFFFYLTKGNVELPKF